MSRRLVTSLTISMVMALAAIAPVSAATVKSSWLARIGSAGVNGTATIQSYTSGNGAIVLKLAKMKPSTLLPVVVSKGTCKSVGSTLLTLASIKTTSAGSASRTTSLTAARVNAIRAATKGNRQDRHPDRDRHGAQVRAVRPRSAARGRDATATASRLGDHPGWRLSATGHHRCQRDLGHQ